ncbi:S-adenosyl-L-methionine-dependent methyltransferase [Xylariaceae sp. FL0804]|nr:S-adenosyl-L-methionine-dependent methyltransferase [Xylariaceae sp. FL0804]
MGPGLDSLPLRPQSAQDTDTADPMSCSPAFPVPPEDSVRSTPDIPSVLKHQGVVEDPWTEVTDLVLDHEDTRSDLLELLGSNESTILPAKPTPWDAAKPSRSQFVTVELPVSTLTQPRSHFEGFVPPAPEVTQAQAVDALLEAYKSQGSVDEDYVEFTLSDFAIYIDNAIYPNELRPLQHLTTKPSADVFYFDGVLSCAETRFYVRRVPFLNLPISGYGSEYAEVDQIWVLSNQNKRLKREIYYKLESPAPEYARFHTPFLWIANLAKHVIDYCDFLGQKGRRACLHDFQSNFSIWISRKHHRSVNFGAWYAGNRGSDFRAAIVANVRYIWKEAFDLDPTAASKHLFWKEIKSFDRFRPNLAPEQQSELEWDEQRRAYDKLGVTPTVVTPYVYQHFRHMVFGQVMKPQELCNGAEKRRTQFLSRTQAASVPSKTIKRLGTKRGAFLESIQAGDIISTMPDDESTDTPWRREIGSHGDREHRWFGLVQKIHHDRSRKGPTFDVLWLYRPMDTPCGQANYLYENELFLSDNCTCHHNVAKVEADQILSTHEVEWFGGPSTSAEFFVRQTYVAGNCQFITLKREHLLCGDDITLAKRDSYQAGDAVLVQVNNTTLEPFLVETYEAGKQVRLRKLLRRRNVDGNARKAPPNELLLTQHFIERSFETIDRRCLVRAFSLEEPIPAPYDRNGTGDAFFITHEEVVGADGVAEYRPLLSTHLSMLRQGFHPKDTPRPQKLRGLDLFCGGGNFGRGLEDAGGVEMRWANDISAEAIHTYMANCDSSTCTPYLGSVDDLLLRALQGNSKAPRPGDVQFISAGSPCPGFSLLTFDKTTPTQRKNQSLVASFASFVDLYRPHYALLENVPQVVSTKELRKHCVFSQLMATMAGIGYQMQIIRMDAWAYGAPQSRTRVFLCLTAPGFSVPKVPKPSHSHPPGTPLTGLGYMACGLPFQRRQLVPTPFKFMSAQEAVGDLPSIQDGKADYCIGFPDHRLSVGWTPTLRKQMFAIPTQPFGMSFSKAWFGRDGIEPVMTSADRELFPAEGAQRVIQRVIRKSKGWGRIDPRGIYGTIPTVCPPTCARTGNINHWEQHRPTSVLEARRAQGFLDHELILGLPSNQYKIIGNSVSRQVALALGLAIREAWFGSLLDEKPGSSSQLHQGLLDNVESLEGEDAGLPESKLAGQYFEGLLPSIENKVAHEIDTSTDELFGTGTPRSQAALTPATSDSIRGPDNEPRKRSPLEILIPSKRPKLRLGRRNEFPQ